MYAPLLRRILPLLIGLATATTGAVAVASTGAGHRTLRLVRSDPATVHGTGFRPRSAVRVTLAAGTSHTVQARTAGTGAFTVTFSAVVDRCTGWTVTAVQRGAAPFVMRGPKPMCAPASTP